jgi:hypothetical protein
MTVGSSAAEATVSSFISAPGTSVPGTPLPGSSIPPARRYLVAGLLIGATVFGTLSVAEPVDTNALRATFSMDRTVPVIPPMTADPTDRQSIEGLLQHLRGGAKLNWGEVADAMAVSRRTIHNWLSGARVSAGHLSRLVELAALVDANNVGDPDATRVRLSQAGPHGRNLLEDFALGSRPTRRVPLSTVSVGDLIESDAPDSAASQAQLPTRRTSLRGGPIPTRRSNAS